MKKISLFVAALAALTMAGTSLKVGGAIYPRYALSEKQSTFELMGAEAILQGQVTSETRDIMYAALQVYTGGIMSGWFKGIHFGEAYAMFPLGLSLPTIKVGQAVVPFGLLETYDIHTQIVQTTYVKSLGLRLDPGLGLTGVLGRTRYALWLSNGNGPDRMDNDKGKVVTARVAPGFLLGDAELTLGLSGLYGSLPYWSLDSLANFPKGPQSYAVKYRLGLDNTTDWGPLTLRLEGIAGKDSSLSHPLVLGYYAEARYALVRWLEVLGKYDGWHANGGRANNLSAGINFYPPNTTAYEVQTTYQIDMMKTGAGDESNWKFITQLVVRI
jgi:hypothetical protein